MYYARRIDFQFRGSSNIDIFLWIINVPTLNEN